MASGVVALEAGALEPLNGWAINRFVTWGVGAYGWRAVLFSNAVAAIVFCLPLCLIVRRSPEPYGYQVDGEPFSDRDEDADADSVEVPDYQFNASTALRSRTFWLVSIIFTTSYLRLGISLPHFLTYLEEAGIAERLAVFMLTGVSVGSIAGRLGGGFIGDRIDKSRLVGDILGSRSFALIFSLMTIPGTIVLFLAPSAAGWVFDTYGTYQPAWIATTILVLLAAPISLLIPSRLERTL